MHLLLGETIEGMSSKAVSQVATVHQAAHTASRVVAIVLALRKIFLRLNLDFKKLMSVLQRQWRCISKTDLTFRRCDCPQTQFAPKGNLGEQWLLDNKRPGKRVPLDCSVRCMGFPGALGGVEKGELSNFIRILDVVDLSFFCMHVVCHHDRQD